jgi:hypothetical protein
MGESIEGPESIGQMRIRGEVKTFCWTGYTKGLSRHCRHMKSDRRFDTGLSLAPALGSSHGTHMPHVETQRINAPQKVLSNSISHMGDQMKNISLYWLSLHPHVTTPSSTVLLPESVPK